MTEEKPRGRPGRKSLSVGDTPNRTVRLPPAVVEGLDRIAARRRITRSDLIRESCARTVAEEGET